jgi:hypothetical protein
MKLIDKLSKDYWIQYVENPAGFYRLVNTSNVISEAYIAGFKAAQDNACKVILSLASLTNKVNPDTKTVLECAADIIRFMSESEEEV